VASATSRWKHLGGFEVAGLEGWRRKGLLETAFSSTEVGGRGVGEALAARGTVLAREGGVGRAEQEVVERLRFTVERNVRSFHKQPVFVRKLAKRRRELGFTRWQHRAEAFGRDIRSCRRLSDVTRFAGRLCTRDERA